MSGSNVLRVAARGLATTAMRTRGNFPNSPAYKKVQDVQTMMCRDDGLLVWQKGGARDKFGYQLTMGIMVLSFIPFSVLLFQMSFPQKKQ